MHMKQKVIEILGSFLKRNEGYVVYAYLKDLAGNILVNYSMHEWNIEENDSYLKLTWYEEFYSNYIAIHYPDVVKCYEEIDEYGQKSIHILFLSGLQLDFECCGERMEK